WPNNKKSFVCRQILIQQVGFCFQFGFSVRCFGFWYHLFCKNIVHLICNSFYRTEKEKVTKIRFQKFIKQCYCEITVYAEILSFFRSIGSIMCFSGEMNNDIPIVWKFPGISQR